jgi:hypothetical protein
MSAPEAAAPLLNRLVQAEGCTTERRSMHRCAFVARLVLPDPSTVGSTTPGIAPLAEFSRRSPEWR